MSLFQLLLLALASFSSSLATLRPRQTGITLTQDITDLQTALYVIAVIQNGTASNACADSGTVDDLEEHGYDGYYGYQLLCEVAVGIEPFPDLNAATTGLQTALTGLMMAENGTDVATRAIQCAAVDVSILDEAALNGTAIQSLICPSASASSSSSISPPLATNTSSCNSSSSAGPTSMSSPVSVTLITTSSSNPAVLVTTSNVSLTTSFITAPTSSAFPSPSANISTALNTTLGTTGLTSTVTKGTSHVSPFSTGTSISSSLPFGCCAPEPTRFWPNHTANATTAASGLVSSFPSASTSIFSTSDLTLPITSNSTSANGATGLSQLTNSSLATAPSTSTFSSTGAVNLPSTSNTTFSTIFTSASSSIQHTNVSVVTVTTTYTIVDTILVTDTVTVFPNAAMTATTTTPAVVASTHHRVRPRPPRPGNPFGRPW